MVDMEEETLLPGRATGLTPIKSDDEDRFDSVAGSREQPLAIHRSRKRINRFHLHRPSTMAEAAELGRQLGPDARYMAGGVDLVNLLKTGVRIKHVIYLPAIPGLDAIKVADGSVIIGCLATHLSFEKSPMIRRYFPSLSASWRAMGSIRERAKGTLAGNLLADNPTYEVAPVLGALEAELAYDEVGGSETWQAVDRLEAENNAAGPLMRAIKVPLVPGRQIVYDRSLYPVVSVALAVDWEGECVIGARAGFGCAFTRPVFVRLPISAPVRPSVLARVADEIAAETLAKTPMARRDHLASSQYRKRMAGVVLRRQLLELGTAADA